MFKKIKIILISIALACAFLPFHALAQNNSPMRVELRPIRVNTTANHFIHVRFTHRIQATERLTITWPEDTRMPELPQDPDERRRTLERMIESIYIGGFPCGSCQNPPELNEEARSLTFHFPRNIDPTDPDYEYTTIIIPDRIGIVNPTKEGFYTLRLSTASHGTMISEPYEIVESRIGVPEGIPRAIPQPAGPFAPSEYTIDFNVGRGGQLIAHQSMIRIRFPQETTFAETKANYGYWITINGVPSKASYNIHNHVLMIITPVHIENAGRVSLNISKEVGIINPRREGNYQLQVSTMEDREWVSSYPYAITGVEIPLSIEPQKTNRNAHLEMLFSLDQEWTLCPDNPLSIHLPEGMGIPESIDNESIMIEKSLVNHVQIRDHEIILTPVEVIPTHEPLLITILPSARIYTPVQPGTVVFYLEPKSLNQRFPTQAVNIEKATLEILHVHPEPWNACEKASYLIHIELGDHGLLEQEDWIEIIFPSSTALQEDWDASLVTVNQDNIDHIILVEPHRIRLHLAQPLTDHAVSLFFNAGSGLTNPCKGNENYHLSILTSKEKEAVLSPEYFIAPPLPLVEVSWSGGEKGENEWFIRPPRLEFVIPSDNIEVRYGWNDSAEDQYETYRNPELMPEGFYVHTLHFYAIDPYGKSQISSVPLKVDAYPPRFEIIQPQQSENYTNQSSFKVTGMIEKKAWDDHGILKPHLDTDLLVNDKKVDINTDSGAFNIELSLIEGRQDFAFSLTSLSGQTTAKTIHFTMNQQAPELYEISPEHFSTTLERSLELKGRTYPHAECWFDQQRVTIDENGYFNITLHTSEPGLKEIEVYIMDRYGNETQTTLSFWFGLIIQMTIGEKTIHYNQQEMINDVPPMIIEQRTYLPVRALSELLQAELSVHSSPISGKVETVVWKSAHHVIEMHVGKNVAKVNGIEKPIDSPPIIVQSRLMAPVRWIIEALGGHIEWNPSTQQIDIAYIH